jgi:hypothetical protein
MHAVNERNALYIFYPHCPSPVPIRKKLKKIQREKQGNEWEKNPRGLIDKREKLPPPPPPLNPPTVCINSKSNQEVKEKVSPVFKTKINVSTTHQHEGGN